MRKLLYIIPFLFLSCSVFQNKNTDKKDTSKTKSTTSIHALDAEIGVIGTFQNDLINKKFQSNAFPVLRQKIRISVKEFFLDKPALKQVQKVLFLDSSNTPTKYIVLHITDKVTLIEELNGSYNKSIFAYLIKVEETNIVTSVSSVFTDKILKRLIEAEEVYLKSNTNSDFVLELYNNEEFTEMIHLSKGTVFDFKTSHFCWSENRKHDITITNITNNKCSKNSYKTYNKAFKKKNEFKF